MDFAIGPNTKVRKLWFDQNPDRVPGAPLETIVVNNPRDFKKYYDAHLAPEKAGTIFGFDCEWICADNQEKFAREGRENWPSLEALERVSASLRHTAEHGQVSLVQISTFHGVTLLCRVCLWDELPKEFVDLIENPQILKVGYDLAKSDSVELFESFRIHLRGTVHLGLFTNHPHFHDRWSSKGGLKAIIHRLFDLDEHFRELNIDEDLRWKSNWNGVELTEAQKFYAAVDSQAALDAFLHLSPIVCGIWPESVITPIGELLEETGFISRLQAGKWQRLQLPLCVGYEYRAPPQAMALNFDTLPVETCGVIFKACFPNFIAKSAFLRGDVPPKGKQKQPKMRTRNGLPVSSSDSDDEGSEMLWDDIYGPECVWPVAVGEAKAMLAITQESKKETMEGAVNLASANDSVKAGGFTSVKAKASERSERVMESYGVGSRSFCEYSYHDLEHFEESIVYRKSVTFADCKSSITHAVNNPLLPEAALTEQRLMRPACQEIRSDYAHGETQQAQTKFGAWPQNRTTHPLHDGEEEVIRPRGLDTESVPGSGWDVPVGSGSFGRSHGNHSMAASEAGAPHGSKPISASPYLSPPMFPPSTFLFPLPPPPVASNLFGANSSSSAMGIGFAGYGRAPPRRFQSYTSPVHHSGFAPADGNFAQGPTSSGRGSHCASGEQGSRSRSNSTTSHEK